MRELLSHESHREYGPLIAGARNLRDLGGYQTIDGKHVRHGLIYRSGSLAGITLEGQKALQQLALRGLCDLRTSRERELQPYAWYEDLQLDYWKRDYASSFGELRRLLESGITSAEQARAAMIEGYLGLPFEQASAYSEIFRRLAAGDMPLIFCCSAGKDRAGTAAALILMALGVPRETVVADYVLTDTILDLNHEIVQRANGDSTLSQQPVEVVRAILGCDPEYIVTMMDKLAPTAAAFNEYLYATLGVNTEMLNSIRSHLLE